MSNWDIEYERGLLGSSSSNALGLDDDDVPMDLSGGGAGTGAGNVVGGGQTSGMFDAIEEVEGGAGKER